MTTENTDTQETSHADVHHPATAPETAADSDPAEEAQKGNREAKYRTERNAAREALATANARIAAMQQREVERLASDLAQPKDLLTLSGKGLEDLLNEDGDVDPELVADLVADVLATRPGLRKRDAAVDPSQGHLGGPHKSEPTWGTLLNPY